MSDSAAEPAVYFELLSFWRFVVACSRHATVRRGVFDRIIPVRYIDASPLAARWLRPLLRRAGVEVERVEFEMRDIKDDRGELVRLRIPRRDLFEFRARVVATEEYRRLSEGGWQCDRLGAFVEKELASAIIMQPDSPARAMYVIEVVRHDARRRRVTRPVFVMRTRPWWQAYVPFARQCAVEILPVDPPVSMPRRSSLRSWTYKMPRAYTLVRRSREAGRIVRLTGPRVGDPKLYVDGRGDVNLSNDGHHSDFFWLTNSSVTPHSVVYREHSEQEREALLAHGVTLERSDISLTGGQAPCRARVPYVGPTRERRALERMRDEYRAAREYWESVFRANNVKIWLTWTRVEPRHMAAADAVAANGGISASWATSFDGFPAVTNGATTNLQFTASRSAAETARQSGARWDYNVITGYFRDYAGSHLRAEAAELRQRLLANGARRIVFVIDENSLDDPRWHTGHALQRENYSAILTRMLETPWLGVIFKPKVARTLRRRLGPVDDLLRAAEATGRCYVFEQSGRHTTSAPPLLAGLAADVAIHAHLSSGTAAMECALEGIPTLLVDREGTPDSKLYGLPVGKVVFRTWSDAIDALVEHFCRPDGVPGFGDWSPIIHELDPFRDGRAAERMGTYLQWLLDGFRAEKRPRDVMAEAADRYCAQWGADKVLE